MTDNKAQKRAIRQRMAETGEKYTDARRELLNPGTSSDSFELRHLVKPRTVSAIVSSGGGTNLALAMPVLARHLDRGGHLVVTQYRDDASAMPGPLDLVVTRGIATLDEVRGWLEEDDRSGLEPAVEAAAAGVQVFKGPTTPALLREALMLGPNPLLYVQDVQTDPPLQQPARNRRLKHEHELVPDNVEALGEVVLSVGASAIVGHCMPADDIESWEPLSKVADHTFAIEHDYLMGDQVEEGFEATVDVFDPDGQLGSYKTVIDAAFLQWRLAFMSGSR